MEKVVRLDGKNLGLAEAILVARGYVEAGVHLYPRVELTAEAEEKVNALRVGLETRMAAGDVIYGVNTGCGSRKCVRISDEDIIAYQRHYIPAHCVGFGDPFPEEVVRLAIVLRVNSFARGNSGVRLELCQRLLQLYNAGVIPYVPQKGSVGASGDLCPLAHMSAVLIGLSEQRAWFNGELLAAPDALTRAGIEPLVLAGKEAMGLTNGSTFILAQGLLASHDASRLLRYSNLALALSLEAIRGETNAFDSDIHEARIHQGQQDVAARVRQLIGGSQRTTHTCQLVCLPNEHKKLGPDGQPIPRVQDAYSFRCYPQAAGPVQQLIEEATGIFLDETGAATDNPLIFGNEVAGYRALSGGNFHGTLLALAHARLKLAVQTLANISNSRFYALLDPHQSYGLPPDLAGRSELNTGLMIGQYTTAALVAEGKVLGHAACLDSVPTSAGQEDFVSMGSIDARQCREMVENSLAVVAWELLAATQGISLSDDRLGNPSLGRGTAAAFALIRQSIDPMNDDRYLMTDHQKMLALMHSGELEAAVEAAL